jgi:hypothetical protein
MGKKAGLHIVQRIQPLAAFPQAHSFVPLTLFFKLLVHKAPKVAPVKNLDSICFQGFFMHRFKNNISTLNT